MSVNVTDVERARRFYVDALGGVPRADRPDLPFAGAWLDVGGQQPHLIEAAVPANLDQHFAFRVADLSATIDELRTAGLEVSDPVVVGSGRQSFACDPDGNLVELHEVGA